MARSNIEEFYDSFSTRFIRDYVYGNPRVREQMEFFSRSIPKNIQSVLVIGCGGGQSSLHIARNCAKKAHILALDISSSALQIARAICSHPRIKYREADILKESIEGPWEIIVLPDVYEHIQLECRTILHKIISRLLSDNGRLLLTCPSPYHQEFLRRNHPEELQIVDETVTLEDLLAFAKDMSGCLSYFNMISVWHRNDYIHAVIEREVGKMGEAMERENLPVKNVRKERAFAKAWGRFLRTSHLNNLVFWVRYRRILRAIRKLEGGQDIMLISAL